MYMLDVLSAASRIDGWDHLVVIDPDLLCMRPLDGLIDSVGESIGAYPLPHYAVDHQINGLSRREAGAIHRELDGTGEDAPTHYGGELLVFPHHLLPHVLERSEAAWQDALDRFGAGARHFVTEEHVLSYALATSQVADLSPYVRRIWTAAIYRVLDGDEGSLTLWHLPAEKRRGFKRFYGLALDETSWWWHADQDTFQRLVGKTVGIPSRSPRRYLYDFARRSRIAKWLAR